MDLQFAKTFTIDKYQVVVMTDYDDLDSFALLQITDLDVVRPRLSLKFRTEKAMLKGFANYNESNARTFVNMVIDATKKCMPEVEIENI